ncbi:MAG: DNA gyrase modulator, partial [Nanoarchaeota archaeon]
MHAKSAVRAASKSSDQLDIDLAHFAIEHAQKIGASYADARLESTAVNGFVLKNGVPQIAGFDRVTGIGVRVVMNKTLGFTCTNDLSKENVRRAVERAAKLTKAAAKIAEKTGFSEAAAEVANYEVKQKIKLDDLEPKDKVKVLFD